MIATTIVRAALVVFCALPFVSGCTQSSLRISPDFGNAVNQNVVAQIADPDAQYEGTPAPGSAGSRVGLAQKRYGLNQVVQPSTTTASGEGSIGRADNGSSGAGVSTAPGQ